MPRSPRTGPLALLAAAVIGAAAGLLVQFLLSSRGRPPAVPPLSLPITLVLIGAVLVVLGIRLRRTVRAGKRPVNPFQAVRLLAVARAGQLVGAILGGGGAGLVLSLLGRSVPAPVASWLPMALMFGGGAVLVACALIAEHLCRIPPGDDDADTAGDRGAGDTDPEAHPA